MNLPLLTKIVAHAGLCSAAKALRQIIVCLINLIALSLQPL